jgi:hypothetical protein
MIQENIEYIMARRLKKVLDSRRKIDSFSNLKKKR